MLVVHTRRLHCPTAGAQGRCPRLTRARPACKAAALQPPPLLLHADGHSSASDAAALDLHIISNNPTSADALARAASLPASLAASSTAPRGGLRHTPSTPAEASSSPPPAGACAEAGAARLLSLRSFSALPREMNRNRTPVWPAQPAPTSNRKPGEARADAAAGNGAAAVAASQPPQPDTPIDHVGPSLPDLNLGWGSWRHKRKWDQEQRARRRDGPFRPFADGDAVPPRSQRSPRFTGARWAPPNAAAAAAAAAAAHGTAAADLLPAHDVSLQASVLADVPLGDRLGVRRRFSSLSSAVAAAAVAEPMDVSYLNNSDVVFINKALVRLGRTGSVEQVQQLVRYALTRADCNTHTYGAAFCALGYAGRADLALAEWEALSRARVDIGPVGASALVKVAARARDLRRALDVFDSLLKRRVTLNRFCYNCVVHACALAGRVDEMLAVYNLMRLETHRGSTPDAYTYSALVRGVLVAGRCELAEQLFENMLEDGVEADSVLWCHFITAAARASNPRAAFSFYQQMLEDGVEPSVHTVNALMTAYAALGNLAATQKVLHQELLGRRLAPDTYTAVAVLTAAARAHASFAAVQAIWAHMSSHGVPVNEFVGTALLTAYRHTPSQPPPAAGAGAASCVAGDGVPSAPAPVRPALPVADLLGVVPEDEVVLAQGRSVLAQLKASKSANANAYTAMIALCLSRRRRNEATVLLREAEASAMAMPPAAYAMLARVCEDHGLPEAAGKLWERAEALEAQLGAHKHGDHCVDEWLV